MFKNTWTLYSRHHIEIKLNILSNAPFFIAFFASTAVTTLRTNIWDALVCAWHRYAVVIPNKKKRDQLQYQNSREQALYSDATNSFGSSCQIFPSFLWGQENIGLAADALVSWSLWERCLAAVATFRPRVSWSLGESRGVLAITIGISPSAQPPPAHHLQTASRLHLASPQLFQI